jgi:hypothetical protein
MVRLPACAAGGKPNQLGMTNKNAFV